MFGNLQLESRVDTRPGSSSHRLAASRTLDRLSPPGLVARHRDDYRAARRVLRSGRLSGLGALWVTGSHSGRGSAGPARRARTWRNGWRLWCAAEIEPLAGFFPGSLRVTARHSAFPVTL